MTQYIIDEELRDSLIGLLILLQKHSEKTYHKYSDGYSNRLLLADGKELRLPFLKDLQLDLQQAEQVIEEKEYNAKAEELVLMAKELGFF